MTGSTAGCQCYVERDSDGGSMALIDVMRRLVVDHQMTSVTKPICWRQEILWSDVIVLLYIYVNVWQNRKKLTWPDVILLSFIYVIFVT
jgi:hypothetical protein